jgi:hypothetical protein
MRGEARTVVRELEGGAVFRELGGGRRQVGED